MTEPRSALVLGATGLVGQQIVEQLLLDPTYTTIRLFTRRPTGFSDARVEEVIVDLEHLPESAAMYQADDLFIAFGTTIKKAGSQERFQEIDLEIPLDFARRARASGTDHCLLVSSVGADVHSKVFYSRVKGALEDGLEEIDFESLQIFRPSFLMGDRQEFRLGEAIGIGIFRFLSRIKDDLFGVYSPMPVPMLAKAMVIAARMELDGHLIYHYREIRNLSRQKL
ncbi:MAG: oxidoreductase [Saprospiraceae bacterium]|nr:oxidoreductase [Saprospiraceae bacterium]